MEHGLNIVSTKDSASDLSNCAPNGLVCVVQANLQSINFEPDPVIDFLVDQL